MPSPTTLAGHHLTEALRHLRSAANSLRETNREDCDLLASNVELVASTARDVRDLIREELP